MKIWLPFKTGCSLSVPQCALCPTKETETFDASIGNQCCAISYMNDTVINLIPWTVCVLITSLFFLIGFDLLTQIFSLFWCFQLSLFSWFPVLEHFEKKSCYIAFKSQLSPTSSMFLCLITFALQFNVVFAGKVEISFLWKM